MRYKFIDEIKGFTIILVVLGHVAERYYLFNIYPQFTLSFGIIYKSIYAFHMPLFMIVSGFLFASAYLKEDHHTINKEKLLTHTINQLIVYIVFSMFAFFSKLIFSDVVLEPISWTQAFKIAYEPIGHLWYIHTLIIFYALTPLIIKASKHYHLLFIAFLLIELVNTYLHPYLPNIINNCTKYAFFFYLGIILAIKPELYIFKKSIVITTGIIAFIILVYSLTSYDMRPDNIHILQLPIAYGLSLLFYFIFKQKNTEICFFEKMGQKSLEIYLLSQYPLTIFLRLLPMITFLNGLFSLITNVALTLVAVFAAIWVLDKFHLYAFLFKPLDILTSKQTKKGHQDSI